ncbi:MULTISPECIES: heavy metal translocating P-type ATPase [unclassified Ruminococcus]|uniref:heavy metal translocating P-type ATPase n=1 Tax=unclassified Ruminococcus TaxID=2608920 RepID=UPI0009310E05|nr:MULTISPECIES: heavy metal translocating P-type ATPase [unclassified Ruminococcus]
MKNFKLTKKQKKMLYRITAAIALLIIAEVVTHAFSLPVWAQIVIFLVPFGVAGYDVVRKAVLGIGNKQLFDENFLMTVATVGAMAVGEYSEGAAVMLFYQVGELFQSIATTRSRKSVAALMDIRPDSAVVIRDGERIDVHPEEVEVGELIEVAAGDKLPLDGIIESGESALNTAALTGESLPREVTVGDEVLSGCVNLTGTLTVRTTKPFGESTVSKILELVENASSKKARAENFITKFARYYTPIVVITAVLVAVLPPLFTDISFKTQVYRALNFLVVSCPCALVISVPMSFFGGIGGASRQGVLIKGGNYMETLSKVGTVIFDKTGTLTKGEFGVTEILTEGCNSEELLAAAGSAEMSSSHPIARSLVRTAEERGIPLSRPESCTEISGKGISCVVGGEKILAGNAALMDENGISCRKDHNDGTAVHIAKNGRYLGVITVSDTLKPDSAEAVSLLKKLGVRTVILTGDNKKAGEAAAKALGIDEVYTELMPQDKVAMAEKLIAEGNGSTAFVGDGINDAPVLSRADVGIAMGAMGADAAIEAADVVLMDDKPTGIVNAVKISRKTLGIVHQNIVFAIVVKVIVLVTSAVGITNMWAAVFADVGVAVLAILNAMRALTKPKKK